jgi:maltose alpha-D-glucosyltransferase / alpha-amylase
MKNDILKRMKKIYSRKFNSLKIRNHGDFHLGQVLFTGRISLSSILRENLHAPSAKEDLKDLHLRDVAGMLRSFHYAVYSSFSSILPSGRRIIDVLEQWADLWFNYDKRNIPDNLY